MSYIGLLFAWQRQQPTPARMEEVLESTGQNATIQNAQTIRDEHFPNHSIQLVEKIYQAVVSNKALEQNDKATFQACLPVRPEDDAEKDDTEMATDALRKQEATE